MNPLKPLSTFATDRQINVIRFNFDGSLLAAGTVEAKVCLFKVGPKALEALPNLDGHHAHVSTLAFHPKENRLYTADSWGQLRCSMLEDGTPKTLWQNDAAHEGWLRQMSLSPDGSQLATCGMDGFVRLWSPEGKVLAEYKHDDDVFALVFHPDGRQVAFGDMHGHLLIWDYTAKKIVKKMDALELFKVDRIQDIGGLRRLVFIDDGKTLIAAGTIPDKGATIQSTPVALAYDIASGKQKAKFSYGALKDGFIEDILLHPDGYLMACTSGDSGNGRLLRFKMGEKEAFDFSTTLPNCQSIALHPDGSHFVIAATNPNAAGNGRPKGEEYPINYSPVHYFELPEKAKPKDKNGNDLLVPSLGL